jgi:CDP-4-dehydro-6-deoxyglucose reductase
MCLTSYTKRIKSLIKSRRGFTTVILGIVIKDDWQGRTGFVHQAVMEDIADLSNYEVYACGSPLMVNAARADFQAKNGLLLENFYSDAFA